MESGSVCRWNQHNVRNAQGDTPLLYLSGNNEWSEQLTQCAILLLKAGANPLLKSEDGSTPLTLMKANNASNPHESRTELIAAIEEVMAIVKAEQASGADESEDEQDEIGEPVAEPEPAKPVQSAQVEQPSSKAEKQIQEAEPAKAVAETAPLAWDALMKLQGVVWGNDGKPMKVSLGDK